jgi:hypothetical protein
VMLMILERAVRSFQKSENLSPMGCEFFEGDFDSIFRIFREFTLQTILELLGDDVSNNEFAEINVQCSNVIHPEL